MRKKNKLKKITAQFKGLHAKFRKQVCEELAWSKSKFKKKTRLSPMEKSTIAGIGWEITNTLRRKLAK